MAKSRRARFSRLYKRNGRLFFSAPAAPAIFSRRERFGKRSCRLGMNAPIDFFCLLNSSSQLSAQLAQMKSEHESRNLKSDIRSPAAAQLITYYRSFTDCIFLHSLITEDSSTTYAA